MIVRNTAGRKTLRIIRRVSSERDSSRLYSPIGLLLVDDFTGEAPLGPLEVTLEVWDPEHAKWLPTRRESVRTPGGVVAYPGLGRTANPSGPAVPYRVQITAGYYRPAYRAESEGIEFAAHGYNDATAPPVYAKETAPLHLFPAVTYPFPSYVPVVRGVVVAGAGGAAPPRGQPDVLVEQGSRERVLTGEGGTFALPLRWARPGVPTPIDARDLRTGRTASIVVTLPSGAMEPQVIRLP